MKLRTKFLLFVFILHLVALVLSYFVFKDHLILFVVSEILLLISVVIAWQLYKEMIRPLQTIMTGIEAIKDNDFNVKFLLTGKYEMDQLISIYNEMMDRMRKERTRQEQQHFFLEKLIQTSPSGIIILDFDANVQQVNAKACSMLGVFEKELLQQPIGEIEDPLFREISKLHSGEKKTVSLNGIRTYRLQSSHFIDRGFARCFITIEELTEEIVAAEKDAYGKVIRMMAHEVNNTVGPVNSILESALNTKNLWSDEYKTLEFALSVALARNQNLNIFMRNFADVVRLPWPNRTDLDLGQLVERVVSLFAFNAADAQINFHFKIPEEPFIIHADEQQLEQVLINICKNSMEAIERNGKIVIALNPGARKLTITDSGTGISTRNAAQIFRPFFSTKKNGQGVGLTLVKEILLNHDFPFRLKTVAEAETVFEIEFQLVHS